MRFLNIKSACWINSIVYLIEVRAMERFTSLSHRIRTKVANRRLGAVLAFVAGAINAGGFMAVHRYTSHMSGIVSSIADDLVLGNFVLVISGLVSLIAFILGASTTAILIHWTRRKRLHSEFAASLMLESVLLLLFGLLGANLDAHPQSLVPGAVLMLCFIMGLQNAILTKISKAEIRTTHMTGVVTDLGIELGRLIYWNKSKEANPDHFVKADREKLLIHAFILSLFFLGGVIGALAFSRFGFIATVPFALLLLLLAMPHLIQDLNEHYRK
jgi:uncharacterized membrane protein YoaK (UPF0700 family)